MSAKVMIVDDSRTVRNQVRAVLAPAGFDIVEAGDGQEGVDQLVAHPDTRLVICDINMPVMTGLEMLTAVKGEGRAAALRFMMLTTEAQPEFVQRAKQGGASGWIIKPFKPEMLLAAVRKLTA